MSIQQPENYEAEGIWTAGDERPAVPVIIHFSIMMLLIMIGVMLGAWGSFTLPLGFGINVFWPAAAVQNVGGIWFGGWGMIAAVLFPIISNGVVATPIYVSLAYIPANAMQALLPVWAFRRCKADPRLRMRRDWLVFLGAVTVGNIFGAIWGPLMLSLLGLEPMSRMMVLMWGWFIGNEVVGIVLGVLVLKTFSAWIINSSLLVQRWFA